MREQVEREERPFTRLESFIVQSRWCQLSSTMSTSLHPKFKVAIWYKCLLSFLATSILTDHQWWRNCWAHSGRRPLAISGHRDRGLRGCCQLQGSRRRRHDLGKDMASAHPPRPANFAARTRWRAYRRIRGYSLVLTALRAPKVTWAFADRPFRYEYRRSDGGPDGHRIHQLNLPCERCAPSAIDTEIYKH